MKKRIVPLLLSTAMLVSLLPSCSQPEDTPTPTPTGEAAIEDGYIPAPYTADASQSPTEYVAPVFYHNEDGPTISVTYNGVIAEGGQYFRDSDNDQELDPFEDWRLSTEERVTDLLGKMTQEQRIGLLKNQLTSNAASTSAEEVYDENGDVILEQLVGFTEDSESYNAQEVLDNYVRSGVIRQYTDTETGALFNNALNMLAEYVGATKGEVTIPYMLISNPMLSGYPYEIGFAAAVTGDGNTDALQAWAETEAAIWDAKGIHQMYGPQIDLVTDPRWTRNSTTYGENPEIMADIATALVTGFQHGTDGVQPGDVAVIMKHFPGDGAAENGMSSHNIGGQWRIYSTEGSLEKYHLSGFQAAIDAGVTGVMPSYSRPATDARSQPQTVGGVLLEPEEIASAYNTTTLQTLLKDIMGFDGFVNSDSGIITQGITYGAEDMTPAERYAAVINAGTDVIGDETAGLVDYTDVTEAVTSGLVTDEAFDRATTNRMKSWIDLGMFDNPYRDPAESRAVGEQYADTMEDYKTEFNQKSVVLMKNSDSALPLADAGDEGLNIYIRKFTGTGTNNVSDELASMGYTGTDGHDTAGVLAALGYNVVEDYNEADVAILMVEPAAMSWNNDYLHVLDLVEDQESPEYDTTTGEKTGDTLPTTTVADIDELWEIADAVHANGGKVIGTIDITSPWILTNLEPYCDALLGGFGTSTQALIDVITGEYSPTGKLPVTMVSCYEVIAVNEETLEDGNTYDICVSPNDVPGYDKEQYMDPAVLAQSPSGSYAYQDADGNFYWSGFGLSY